MFNVQVRFVLAAGLAVVCVSASLDSQPDGLAETLLRARTSQRAGEYHAARAILMEALSKAPESAALLDALGSIEQDTGNYFEAERSYLHALSASARTGGDVDRLCILNNLGTLYLDTRQYTKGERIRQELEKVRPGALNSHPTETALLLNVLASLEHARNRGDEAERYYAQSLQILRKAGGPVSADAAAVENNLGFLHLEAGRYEAAENLFRQSIHEIEIALGPDDRALIQPLVNLAKCEYMSGRPDDAEGLARRAVELSGKIFGTQHPVTATAMLHQAAALRKSGRKAQARGLEKRAKASLKTAPAADLARYTVEARDLARHTKP
jgi:tetratricopeptide (TPR) repeat protein